MALARLNCGPPHAVCRACPALKRLRRCCGQSAQKIEVLMSKYAQPILFFFCRPCGDYHKKTHPHYAAMKRRAAERKARQAAPNPKIGEARSREVRDRLMIALGAGCGLRVSELVNLSAAQFDDGQGILHVRGKGGKVRLVPVPDNLIDDLRKAI